MMVMFIVKLSGLCGLKQEAKLARDQLIANLKVFGQYATEESQNNQAHVGSGFFCLYVDDYGIKYSDQDDADHLLTALYSDYEIVVNTVGFLFCELAQKWDYRNKYVDISMSNNVQKSSYKA